MSGDKICMKNNIRKTYKTKRAQMSQEDVRSKSRIAAKKFLLSDIYKTCKTLMLYMPLGNETDTSEIVKTAFKDGKRLVFPVTDAKTAVITPYYATEHTKFSNGAFSVSEPASTSIASVSDIDVVLVPGIAFAKNGARVGFGKGCYDKLLINARATKVGFCYDFQMCDNISVQAHDICMDYIVTNAEFIKCDS